MSLLLLLSQIPQPPNTVAGGSLIGSSPLGAMPLGSSLLRPNATSFLALCLDSSGVLTYKLAATSADSKVYLNQGQLYSRLTAIAGDKLVTLISGALTAT